MVYVLRCFVTTFIKRKTCKKCKFVSTELAEDKFRTHSQSQQSPENPRPIRSEFRVFPKFSERELFKVMHALNPADRFRLGEISDYLRVFEIDQRER